jgi:hypothetical protein
MIAQELASLIVAVVAFVVVGTSVGALVLGAVFILEGERWNPCQGSGSALGVRACSAWHKS